MLERLGKVIDWLAFTILITTLLTMMYMHLDKSQEYIAIAVLMLGLPPYLILQLIMYIVRGKVRFLPWD